MLPSLCVFCQTIRPSAAHIPIRPRRPLRVPTPPCPAWPNRTLASSRIKPRRPSRMQLSPPRRVAKPEPGFSAHRKQSRRAEPAGPWAETNQTLAYFGRGTPVRSAAQEYRSRRSRGAPKELEQEKGRDWKYKVLRMQRSLAEVRYTRRQLIKEKIRKIEDFGSLELLPAVQDSIGPQGLPGLDNLCPTPIQKVAIPALLGTGTAVPEKDGYDEFLLAAETGSGKTLAYLLPTIHAMKCAEEQEKVESSRKAEQEAGRLSRNLFEIEPPLPTNEVVGRDIGQPRVVILVPTAELVDQVGAVAKSFSHTVKFRAVLFSSAFSARTIRKRLFTPWGTDMLIATPHMLSSIATSLPRILARVTHLVIDEADSLFDKSFKPKVDDILSRASPTLKQLILCSATIPRWLDSHLRTYRPNLRRLTTPNLHAVPRRVQLTAVDVTRPGSTYSGSKDLACADAIHTLARAVADPQAGEDGPKGVKRVMVFVNEREKAVELAEYLRGKGIDAEPLNRDVGGRYSKGVLAEFTGAGVKVPLENEADDATESGQTLFGEVEREPGRLLPGVRVLVATDIASRGIDTTMVKDVILYDVPHTTIDFIHRLGRVGRMGRRGRGIVLLGKGDRKDVVKEVREAMFRGQALI